jgi:hypothetical protein
MPISAGDDQIHLWGQLDQGSDDGIAIGNGEGSARKEVGLNVTAD